jgi:hypothetical protein
MSRPLQIFVCRFHLILALALSTALELAISSQACGSIIINDTFTGTDGTALIGRLASPTDTPASTYAGNGNVSLVGGVTGLPYEADIQGNTAHVGGDAGLALNLGLATPQQFQLSITFNISADTENQTINARRGAGLGFFSSVALGTGGSSHCYNNFTGLAVDNTGSVRLIVAGANSGVATTVSGFDPSVSHTLSYVVDTLAGSGLIFNILLDGASVSLTAPVNTFTSARTALGGFYNSSGFTEVATYDDFTIGAVPVPEASTFAGVSIAALFISFHYLLTTRRTGRAIR